MAKRINKSTLNNNRDLRPDDVPVKQRMLKLVRNEIKSDIHVLRSEMHAQFKNVDSRFSDIDGRFNKVDSRFSDIDARFNKVDSRFSDIDARFNAQDAKFNSIDARFEQVLGAIHQVSADVARIGTLVEEQNARNEVVLEALSGLFHRQDRVERRMDSTESLVRTIISHSKN